MKEERDVEREEIDSNYMWDAPPVRSRGKCVQYEECEGIFFIFIFIIFFFYFFFKLFFVKFSILITLFSTILTFPRAGRIKKVTICDLIQCAEPGM